MKTWFKYIVTFAMASTVAVIIGCGDKNKRDSIPGFNPGFGFPGFNSGFPGAGGWGQGVSSISWVGQLTHSNGKEKYKAFLKDTGICGNIARSLICSAIDGGAPYATLNLDPYQVVAGTGAWGSLTINPRSSNNFAQGSPLTMSGQFRSVNGNSVLRAEQIYGISYNYNRETTIDVIGDPNSGQLSVVVYYRGKTQAHAILHGNVRIQSSGGGGAWWGHNTWW